MYILYIYMLYIIYMRYSMLFWTIGYEIIYHHTTVYFTKLYQTIRYSILNTIINGNTAPYMNEGKKYISFQWSKKWCSQGLYENCLIDLSKTPAMKSADG